MPINDYRVMFYSGNATEQWDIDKADETVDLIQVENSDDSYYQSAVLKFHGESSGKMIIGSNLDVMLDDGSGFQNIFSGYINRITRETVGQKLYTLQGVGRTFDLSRFHISSKVSYADRKTAYIVSSLVGSYASGDGIYIKTDLINVTDGVSITDIDFENIGVIDALDTLTNYDNYNFIVTSGSKLKYYEPIGSTISVSESDLIEYTPPEESDDSLINDCLVIGKEKFSLIESVTQDGGGYAAGGETWGPTGCVITDLAVKAGSLANTYDNDTATSGTLEFSSQGTIKWGWDGQDVYKFKIYTSQFKDDGAANTKTLFNTGVTATINPGSGGDLDYTRDDNTDTYVIWGIDTTYTGEITVITYPLVSAEPVNRVYIMGEQVLPAQDGYRTKLTTIEVYDNTATWKTAWTGSSEFFINYYEYVMFSLSTIYYGVTQIRFTIELHCDNTAGSTKRFYLYDMCFDAYSDNNTYISKIEYYQNQTWNVDSQDISWYPTEYSWEIRDFAATRTCSSVRLTINSEDASRLTPSFNEIEIMTATTPGYFYISTLSARAAQQFEAKEDYLSGFKLYLNRSTGDYTPSFLKGGVYTDSGDAPGTLVTNSDKFSISTSDVPNPPMWAKDYFEWNYEDEELALTKGANYWLVLQGENTISSATGAPERYWQVGKSSDDYFGLCKTSIDASQSWVNQAGFNLKMYIGWIKKPLTGDYQDTTSINNYGRYYNKVEDDTILTETEAETLAENIVTKYKDPLKRGNVTIDGTLDAKIGEDIIINLSRLGVNETTPIRSYSHIIDGTGFKTSIQWGEHEYSLAKEIAKLRGEV